MIVSQHPNVTHIPRPPCFWRPCFYVCPCQCWRPGCSWSPEPSWCCEVWILNSGSVLTISAQYGILSNNPNATAINRSTNQVFSWEFVLRSVQHSHQGQVTCDLHNIQRQTADLFVQVLCAFLIWLSLSWLPTGRLTVFSMAEKQRITERKNATLLLMLPGDIYL